MFFAKDGEYKPCGMYTPGHFILLVISVVGIYLALKKTIHKNKDEILKIIRYCTIAMWIFEFVMIAFKTINYGFENVNQYLPLYYCSMLLYAGLLSGFTKGKLKNVGDVFLATGGIVGGIAYLVVPVTSIKSYPMFHLVSMHSFIFHSIMVYLGILINVTNYVEIKFKDIKEYAILVGVLCLIALGVNNVFDGNLMFISKTFPGTVIDVIYKLTGNLFTPVMIIGQMTLPFIAIYAIIKLIQAKKPDIIAKKEPEKVEIN